MEGGKGGDGGETGGREEEEERKEVGGEKDGNERGLQGIVK